MVFAPTENTYFRGVPFKSHRNVVRAGLNPIDWMEIMSGEGIVLHKIVLSRQQAERCVVAEALFRPTEEELTEFIKRMHIHLVGSKIRYDHDDYEKSFVGLLEYSGGYNLPEVLIPFLVKAEIVYCAKVFILIWKLKMWLHKKMRTRKSKSKSKFGCIQHLCWRWPSPYLIIPQKLSNLHRHFLQKPSEILTLLPSCPSHLQKLHQGPSVTG